MPLVRPSVPLVCHSLHVSSLESRDTDTRADYGRVVTIVINIQFLPLTHCHSLP